MSIRVRFAPSPTGPFSLGNARTALFNWLFARHHKGTFLIRIEDTDKERSKKEYEEMALSALKWLGIESDEPIIHQSERGDRYAHYVKKLFDTNQAYYCFCTSEELEAEYQAQMSQGIAPKYGGKCRHIKKEDAETRLEKGEQATIRFRMPEKRIAFTDMVRGKVEFDTALFGDIIIAKSLTEPLYNFAVVVDDYETQITHVIRGEDHTPNTPKQIALQEALGFPQVHYGHLPFILGADRKKLSKRTLTSSMLDYKEQGYLASAMINMLALLGWHPEKDREVLTTEEIINEFDMKRVQKAGAVFNPEKLDWLNMAHIKLMSDETLKELLVPHIPPEWKNDKDRLMRVIHLEKNRMRKINEFITNAKLFFELPEYPASLLLFKGTTTHDTESSLKETEQFIKNISENEFNESALNEKIMGIANERGRGMVLWPLRVALSGKEMSPGPIELLTALGKKESLVRIAHAIQKIEGALRDRS